MCLLGVDQLEFSCCTDESRDHVWVWCCPAMRSICVQALSNSIWALAHLKSRGMDVDATRAPNVMRFLNELAGAAARALARPHASCSPPGTLGELRLADAQRYLGLVEREFSCQVGAVQLLPVVVVWGLAHQCVSGVCS